MATLFPVLQYLDDAGNPLSSGTLTWCQAGTTTPIDTWKDSDEITKHANPTVLDSDGRAPGGATFIRGSCKLIVKDSLGATLYTIDDINEYDSYDFTGLTASIADLNATKTTAALISSVYTVSLLDRGKTIMADAFSAGFAINLLPAATAGNTFKITIKKVDVSTNTVTIIPSGVQTIDRGTNFVLYDANDFIELHCDGSNWKIVSSQQRGTIYSVTTATTVTISDHGKLFACDTTSGSFNLTLPDTATVGSGFTITAKKIDSSANTVTLLPSLGESIDGDTAGYSISGTNQTVQIKSTGTNWYVVFEANDVSTAITGDVKTTFNSNQPGWVLMNDGTIGDASSGATTRANNDTYNLFILLWNNALDAWCPVVGGRGATAAADWGAHKRMTLPKALGRVLVSLGSADGGFPAYVLAQHMGESKHTLNIAETAAHGHGIGARSPAAAGTNLLAGGDPRTYTFDSDLTGSSTPHNNMPPGLALHYFIKL